MINLGARVRMSPNESQGPSRRDPGALVPSGYQWPGGSPTWVRRTPDPVIMDEEPGGAVWPGLDQMKFLPDGRLVPAGALGDFGDFGYFGATDFETQVRRYVTFGIGASAVAGAVLGLLFSSTGTRLRSLGLGTAVGVVGGGLLTGIVGRASALGAQLTATK